MYKQKLDKGFTLIEMMVVVAIIGIVTAFAVSSYSKSGQKAKRADAKQALQNIASEQEKYYFRENTYTDDLSVLNTSSDSSNGYYSISVSVTAADTSCASDGACFLLTATAKTTGAQASDSSCKSFTLDSRGSQLAYNSSSTLDSAGVCW
ncbi:type IV pilin protein [Agaribacterium sp. ZY112]|uniref:type IV pilin protein n=1 Tax=Agaribacterium sp. ZY112 TaxID=3233574 RepID=UPI0035255E55